MRSLARVALVASLLGAGCGSRTGLGLGGTPHDASVRATDATQPADAGSDVAPDSTAGDAGPGEAAVDAFTCGNIDCSDSKTQYCLTTYGGECELTGTVCTTSVDCCSDFCVSTSMGGVCSVPGLDAGRVDAGPSGHYACPTLPSDCRTSPPTCVCVVAHEPCGPNFGYFIECTESGGIVKVTCGME